MLKVGFTTLKDFFVLHQQYCSAKAIGMSAYEVIFCMMMRIDDERIWQRRWWNRRLFFTLHEGSALSRAPRRKSLCLCSIRSREKSHGVISAQL
ncbi:hypothetical protein Q7C36_006864 [Tachysurus vachellii]|uniref:Uncharacterized protein n=1 Tax=Tachysurus vachellii TaxID=175792 RepID=A0AA88NGB0_TACVA|nr:hypothetical protein Q7C36_006864 [Tachysurus vachellii]